MDVDPMENIEEKQTEKSEKEESKSRLNSIIAVTVAILATFMGICKIKDDNIVQQMQQDQAKSIDAWGWFQAKKTRLQFAQSSVDQYEIQMVTAPDAVKQLIAKKLAKQVAKVKEETASLDKVQKSALNYDADYDRWNVHDDQFDMSDAALAVAISLLAVTSLTQKKWLFVVSMVPTAFGIICGVSGLLGLAFHPNMIAKWLGT